MIDLKGKKNISEDIDKIIARLAEANQLRGVIDNAHFNDEAKLGKGQEMVDKLTGLIAIFQRDEFNFKNNKAGGDDILGDAYEYLMRNFATESGKSKGQFYTPAEVSRILAKVVGIDQITPRIEDYSVYEIKELLVNRKWYYTIFDGISALYAATSHSMAGRILELAERYESTLPELEAAVTEYEAKVKAHLERMGFT